MKAPTSPSGSAGSSQRPYKNKRDDSAVEPLVAEEGTVTSLFFDFLPDNALENTTRQLSSDPNARGWPAGISSEDISSFHQVNREYGRPIATRFDTMGTLGYTDSRLGKNNEIIIASNWVAYNVF